MQTTWFYKIDFITIPFIDYKMSLPFELRKYHKNKTLNNWRIYGLKETDEFIESLYNRYIYTSHCELCNKEFKTTKDRHMEHDHETGRFRNIVCNRCNNRKHDVKMNSNNTSGYKGIYKQNCKTSKQGYTWRFDARINGKKKPIKSSVSYDKLVAFATQWKIDNNYIT